MHNESDRFVKVGERIVKSDVRLWPQSRGLRVHSDVQEVLKANNVELPDEFVYTAWYLFNMSVADYPKTHTSDKQHSLFVEETLCDPDGMPENVLSCFVTKMCNAGVPIYWERFM